MKYTMLALLVLVGWPSVAGAQRLFSQGRLALYENSGEFVPRFTTLQVLGSKGWQVTGFAIISEPFWVAECTAGVPVKLGEAVTVTPGVTVVHNKFGALMAGPNLALSIDLGRGGKFHFPVGRHLRDVREDDSQWAFIANYSNGPWRFTAQTFNAAWEALVGRTIAGPVTLYLLRNSKGFGVESRISIVW